ncbi:hypothetical protein N9L77_07780 [Pseudomonadales bacterium]|nr:hypothetical protein [Pseudomonadales bacterium]
MKLREAGLQKLWLQGDFPLRGKANETLITATAICKTSGTKVEFE